MLKDINQSIRKKLKNKTKRIDVFGSAFLFFCNYCSKFL